MKTGTAGGRGRGKGREGIALLHAVFAAVVAAGLVGTALTMAMSTGRTSGMKRYSGQAQYLAEGAVEAAKKDIQTAIANWAPVPQNGSVTFGGQTTNYTVTPTGFATTVTDPAGIQTLITAYEVASSTSVQHNRAGSHRIIHAEATPIFQYAVFYTNDLEVLPGANMTIRGRVHTNSDMYLGSGATLTMDTNYVRSVGEIFRHRKDNPNLSEGTVQIRQWVANPFNGSEPTSFVTMNSKPQMTSLGVPSTSGYDCDFQTGHDANGNGVFTDSGDWLPWGPGALGLWGPPAGYTDGSGYTVQSSEHGMTEAVVPQIGSIQMFEPSAGGDYSWNGATGQYDSTPGTGTHSKGYYHSQADLSIITYANGTSWKAFDGNGVEVTSAIATAITTPQLYDARQAGGTSNKVKLTQIDIGKLATTGKFPANGLLYAAHYGAGTGLNAKGIKLTNGATLPSKLTVVSENPIYVKGDYNTVNKKGAAVIGDAINLLSKIWNDGKTQGNLPAAADSTYNVAMISGNQDSSVGAYNGGLENLPRFHENWSGKVCTIKGSFVNTWLSQFATGGWAYGGDRYTAPNRSWSYDTGFNDITNLPPFTPMVVRAADVVSW